MIETTVQHVIDDTISGNMQQHYLYLVRDGDVVFYVGKAVDPITRFHQHLALIPPNFTGYRSQYCKDALGRLICSHAPESDLWTVAFFTLEDLHLKHVPLEQQEYSIDAAETGLIQVFKPCLNIHKRTYRDALPERYEKRLREFYR